ncbi:hypothetical protein LEP1GSC170_6227 [Leptospira interrogans serovar Bataviae str. HAI135]|nr:hypothetical protein LEP1GSC170_6227 [Leptospira interrogans serovar Bataviae str. HAI135]
MNAYLWVGVQGVVALSLLFAPIFLRRTHVKLTFLFKEKVCCKICTKTKYTFNFYYILFLKFSLFYNF